MNKTFAKLFVEGECGRVILPKVQDEKIGAAWLAIQKVIVGYGEPHRVYHSTVHLAYALKQLQRWESRLTPQEHLTAFVALLLHDFVYNIPPAEMSNETLSGLATDWFLPDTGLSQDVRVWDVKQAIFATEGHHVHDIVDMVVCWCDLWGLSRSRKVVEANAQKIREEYLQVYSEEEYAAGRRQFLENYRSPFRTFPDAPLRLRAQAWWLNLRANRNMARELKGLS